MEPLPSGRWRATLPGPRVAGSSKTFATKDDALRWLRGQADKPKPVGSTLGDWLDGWLLTHKAGVAPQSFRRDRQTVDAHLAPLRDVRFRDLTKVRVERWLAQLHTDGVSPSERKRAAVVLRKVLNAAVAAEVIPASPMARVKIPKHRPAEVRALDAGQAGHLCWVAGSFGWEAAYRLWIDAALRPGELLGLHRDDFDAGNGTISVRRSLDHVEHAVRDPKTPRSRRTLPLSARTAELLRDHVSNSTGKVMFADAVGGYLRLSNFSKNVFRPVAAAAEVPWITPYTLRHTAATILLSAGVSLRTVADRLGHEDPALTLRTYAHALPNDQKRAAETVENLLAPVRHAFATGPAKLSTPGGI